jgi:cytochrome c oxidase subunit III
MEIPYTVTARPDTGLYNAKVGIWLFLASEVMLFGGLFSAYIFMRLGSEPGYWPHGLLNVPVGTMNTAILIASSVTVVLAWAALKMRRYTQYWWYMLATIIAGSIFLIVKLSYEWPEKYHHFGVFVKKESLSKYDQYLGNEGPDGKIALGAAPRIEISGHLIDAPANSPYKEDADKNAEHFRHEHHDTHHGEVQTADPNDWVIQMDPVNADPKNPDNFRPSFWPKTQSTKLAIIKGEDVEIGGASRFMPRHSTYFACYFLITGLHGLHVLAGVLVFVWFFVMNKPLYLKNPEHLANRVEVAGLFWHFVDLVWIFVFPIFYLL